jgi:L,D-peptidoglycan transpeptidase YkuD (ErfK/YbiS/YcfS/YnhG family)
MLSRRVLQVCGLLTAVGVFGVVFAGAPPMTLLEVERARLALRRAQEAVGKDAPEEIARAQQLRDEMERRLATERDRFPPLRQPDGIADLAHSVQQASEAAMAHAKAVRSERVGEAHGRAQELEDRLATLKSDVDAFPADRRLRTAYRRAELALEQVRKGGEDGEMGHIQADLDSAATEIAQAEKLIDSRYARLHDTSWRRRWQSWAERAVEASRRGGTAIVVDKLEQRCLLLRNGRVVSSFAAELGRNGFADKLHAGDAATPEGVYRVKERRQNGATRYYRALLLDYPNDNDWREFQAAKRRGQIPRGWGIGGLIEIHGSGGKGNNWTDGCVALSNADMDRLFPAVSVGTTVAIVGTARLPR